MLLRYSSIIACDPWFKDVRTCRPAHGLLGVRLRRLGIVAVGPSQGPKYIGALGRIGPVYGVLPPLQTVALTYPHTHVVEDDLRDKARHAEGSRQAQHQECRSHADLLRRPDAAPLRLGTQVVLVACLSNTYSSVKRRRRSWACCR